MVVVTPLALLFLLHAAAWIVVIAVIVVVVVKARRRVLSSSVTRLFAWSVAISMSSESERTLERGCERRARAAETRRVRTRTRLHPTASRSGLRDPTDSPGCCTLGSLRGIEIHPQGLGSAAARA
jgi:hypothetical protein